jgi:hypothetical protein
MRSQGSGPVQMGASFLFCDEMLKVLMKKRLRE